MNYKKAKRIVERLNREHVSEVEIRAAKVVMEIADPKDGAKIGIQLTKEIKEELFSSLVTVLQDDPEGDFNAGGGIVADIFLKKIPMKIRQNEVDVNVAETTESDLLDEEAVIQDTIDPA